MRRLSTSDKLKYCAKWTLAHVLYWLGILNLWKRIALRRRAVVLVYHRVLPDDSAASTWSHPAIVVTRGTFERHMRLLGRAFRVLTITEFVERMRGARPFETGSCLVTFDDGWSDVYTEAWPVLKRERIPSVIFLPVKLIGSSDVFWQERLGDLLHQTLLRCTSDRRFEAQAREVLKPFKFDSVLSFAPSSARPALMDYVRLNKHQVAPVASAAITALEELLVSNDATSGHSFMSWEQVRAMSGDGVAFGGHSATHQILTTLPPTDLEDEIAETRRVLDKELAGPSTVFSYPNGDWNQQVADTVVRHGFDVAFSMGRGLVSSADNRLCLRRVNIFEETTNSAPLFLARILGVF